MQEIILISLTLVYVFFFFFFTSKYFSVCNSEIVSKQEAVLAAVSFLLQTEASLKSVFESVQLVYHLSQFSTARTRIIKSNYFQRYIL